MLMYIILYEDSKNWMKNRKKIFPIKHFSCFLALKSSVGNGFKKNWFFELVLLKMRSNVVPKINGLWYKRFHKKNQFTNTTKKVIQLERSSFS